ncbi:hypothetical protein HZS_4380, partial [Henneguya salminicola]
MNSGFLRPNTKFLPESLRGVDLINLNPPTIANSNFALILAFFYTNLIEHACATKKMAEILFCFGVLLTPKQVGERIRNLKIKFGDELSSMFQKVESECTVLPHRKRKDATPAVTSDTAKISEFPPTNSSAEQAANLLRDLRSSFVRVKCSAELQTPLNRPLKFS